MFEQYWLLSQGLDGGRSQLPQLICCFSVIIVFVLTPACLLHYILNTGEAWFFFKCDIAALLIGLFTAKMSLRGKNNGV